MKASPLVCTAAVLAFAASPAVADGVAIVSWQLTDNGDDDGYADTLETVELHLTVRDTTPVTLHDVVLRLETTSPEIACIGRPLVAVGDLEPDETRLLDSPFVFTVGETDRAALGLDAYAPLSARFEVHVQGDELSEAAVPQAIMLDLDLDVSGGSGPTTFFEGFESGTFGAFEGHNIDAGLHSLTGSNGYRCQYSDPDWSNSNSYGQITDCFLGANQAHAEAFFWQINTPGSPNNGKAFSGNNSLYMGIFGPTANWQTTPLAHLEAVRLAQPINLADGAASPELSIKHQAGLYTDIYYDNSGEATERGIVGVQLADAQGQPVGDWIRLEPYLNVYDTAALDNFFSCTFDPIDDGNTEDDFFDPADPNRRLGPSSTCRPQLSYATIGDTFFPFDPTYTGFADGPGLQGSLGVGTWVESRFSLDRFRGRRVRLRFLTTGIKFNSSIQTWDQVHNSGPGPGDDGWWIDDVVVTNTLTQPAMIVPDTRSNLGLPGHVDGDADGRIDACDTCPDVFDPAQTDLDGDGVGDPCDNCIDRINGMQLDSDADGAGDDCDACPLGEGADEDGDGLACLADNCPGSPNPQQTDRDADGGGDACDTCPLDPADDADRDGACAEVDSCPLLHNAEQSTMTRVTSLPLRGEVTLWTLSPDSRTVVYRADGDVDDEFRLYAKSLVTGATADLGPVPTYYVWPRVSPDGAWVVYQTYAVAPVTGEELYAVPTAGGVAVRLDDRAVHSGPVQDYLISPDNSTVVYRAQTDSATELFSVPIGGGTPVKLNAPLAPYGNVTHVDLHYYPSAPPYLISPDGETVVYHADQELAGRHELYAVPIRGGTPIRLNGNLPPGSYVRSLQDPWDLGPLPATFITSDGAAVLYLADQGVSGKVELYRVPIGGGSPVQLNRALAGGDDVSLYVVTPDEAAVIYSTSTTIDSVPRIGGTPVQLVATNDTRALLVSPDGGRIVYDSQGLWSVPAAGGASTLLEPRPYSGYYQTYEWVSISPDSGTVVYLYTSSYGLQELLSVPIGGGPQVLLKSDVEWFPTIAADSASVVYWSYAPHGVWRVPIGGGAPVRLDDPLGSVLYSGFGFAVLMSPDRSFVTFRRDYGARDVYAVAVYPNPDADGVLSQCDNCPGASNLDQADEDADGRGGACDNCRFAANVEQQDADLDGAGDACDCAPSDPAARPPDEVRDVRAAKPAPNVVRLSWAAAAGADVYAVSRVRLSLLGPEQFGPCFDPARAETWIDDATTTQPGVGFGYMIQSVDTLCGHGTLGIASDGTERTNLDAAACP